MNLLLRQPSDGGCDQKIQKTHKKALFKVYELQRAAVTAAATPRGA